MIASNQYFSIPMKKALYLILLIFFLYACSSPKRTIEPIEFKLEYKFSSEIEEKVKTDTVPWKYQISASDFATKGDYKNALTHWDLAMRGRKREYAQDQIDSINRRYEKVNAVEYIVNQAKKTEIVIINEAHHNSFHRVFTRSLLQKLFDQGYQNLGLEALGNGEYLDAELNTRKYPIQETGFYTKDPQFGNLIRDALEIGYNLFPYENIGEGNGKPREIGQARNIQKVMESKPGEKFLIHCGFDHALEGNHRAWEKAMAARLAEYTGQNPLTINQTEYSEKGNSDYTNPLLKALDVQEPSVILDKEGVAYQYKRGESYTDIAVFHPVTQYVEGRPDWLFKNDNEKVDISLEGVEIEFPVMVLAFKAREDISIAVPVDITEAKNKEELAVLGLAKGSYTMVVTNGKESVKFKERVE